MSETTDDCDCTATVAADDTIRIELPARSLVEAAVRGAGGAGGSCCPGCPCC
jgi:hypothetical protein